VRSSVFRRSAGWRPFGFPAAAAAGLLVAAILAQATTRAQAPATGEVTTLSGIYTNAQATRGEQTYFAFCVSCHPRNQYTGASFKTTWGGRPLSDLYDWIKFKMPKSSPGSLSTKESAQVLAFILKLNRMPAGTTELPTDMKTLETIRIELR
jgi:mono/diheme cytochrome c family protein